MGAIFGLNAPGPGPAGGAAAVEVDLPLLRWESLGLHVAGYVETGRRVGDRRRALFGVAPRLRFDSGSGWRLFAQAVPCLEGPGNRCNWGAPSDWRSVAGVEIDTSSPVRLRFAWDFHGRREAVPEDDPPARGRHALYGRHRLAVGAFYGW